MLPIPSLDDERFREITENARRMIPRFYPGWTDFNFHDPGITFLELFSFLKESQQYHLDQIGPRNRQKYLKLLGIERFHRAPARLRATVSGVSEELTLPRGTRLFAGNIPFETERWTRLSSSRLQCGLVWDGEKKLPFSTDAYAEEGKLRLEAFGRAPIPGSALYLGFGGPLPAGRPVRLYLNVNEEYPVSRNPVDGADFVPLAELSWEYLSREGWLPMQILRDETCGLLFSGEVIVQSGRESCTPEEAPEEAAEQVRGESAAGWIRARLVRGSYDVPPLLVGLSDEAIPAVQRETAAECVALTAAAHSGGRARVWDDGLLAAGGEYVLFLRGKDGFWHAQPCADRHYDRAEGQTSFTFSTAETQEQEVRLLTWRSEFSAERRPAKGTGFPNQSFELEHKGEIYESFQLLVAEADRPDTWSFWEKVSDFDASGPEDRHFILDEESGVVRFGDCEHGLAPEGEILIAAQATTLGEGGNIKAGQLRAVHPDDLALSMGGRAAEGLRVQNHDNAFGGHSRESEEDCFLRCRRRIRQSERAVTYDDYERLVRQTPGLMISNCKAVPVTRLPRQDGSLEENCVTVVVEPYSAARQSRLSDAYVENILRYLEERRMLGSRVEVLAPEYVGISVYAEIIAQPHYIDARERIQAAVAAFFGGSWEFGSPVRYSALYGIIDTLDCVAGIESLTIDAQGKGITRGMNGDVILPYNGLAILKNAGYQVRSAE